MAKVKINITVDEELLNEIDNYCDETYSNRSMLFSQSVLQTLNYQKMINAISDVSFAMKRCAEQNVVDEDLQAKMKDFETLSRIFINR